MQNQNKFKKGQVYHYQDELIEIIYRVTQVKGNLVMYEALQVIGEDESPDFWMDSRWGKNSKLVTRENKAGLL